MVEKASTVPVKPGWKTTEFWVTMLIQIIGFVAIMGWVSPDQQGVLVQAATQLGGLVAMVGSAFGYNLSRARVKGDASL